MSGSIGSIMNPGTVAPINVPAQQTEAMAPWLAYAKLQQEQAQVPLIGAQTAETQARIPLLGAQADLAAAQARAVPSEIALRGAQTGLTEAQIGAVPSEIAQKYASANNMNASAGAEIQRAWGAYLTNYQTAPQASLYGRALGEPPPASPPPPSYQGPPNRPQPISQVVPPQLLAPSKTPIGFNPNDPKNEAALAQITDPTLQQYFLDAARTENVPLPFLVAQGMQESSLNPNAPRGASGEYGILQVMPGTGAQMGFSEAQLAQPRLNIQAGARYLRYQLNQSNNPLVASAAYNTGTPGTAVPNYLLGTPGGSPGFLGNLNRIYGPSATPAGAPQPNQPIQVQGMPGPSPALMAAAPGGISGTPEQRLQFQKQRANTMATIFSSAESPQAGVNALAQNGFITPAQQADLLAHPENARNFISQQLPIADQPTPGVKAQIERDTPLMAADLSKNESNVDAGLRAATDQYNLKNIKTLVAGTPDNLLGAAAQTRLALQAYAMEFAPGWGQDVMSKITGDSPLDVPTLQALQKDFLSNVLSNERTQGVQRIGALSTQYFQKASPSIDMTKPAVQQITNLGLVAQQMTRDFADASNNAYSASRSASNDSLVNGPYQQYRPLTDTLEKQWLSPDSPHGPDVYAAAANLMNGTPPSKAFTAFDPKTPVGQAKQTEALNIIKRTDPGEIQAILARRGL